MAERRHLRRDQVYVLLCQPCVRRVRERKEGGEKVEREVENMEEGGREGEE